MLRSFLSMTAPRARTPIAPCAAPRSLEVTSGRSARSFATAAAAVSPIIRDRDNLYSNTVRGLRHEMRSLPQTTTPIRPPLLADAILLEDLRGRISWAS